MSEERDVTSRSHRGGEKPPLAPSIPRMEPLGTLCSSIWASTAARMRLGGGAMFRLCSARVSQLMKSCREFWKSVARANASSSFACGSGEGEKREEKTQHGG